MYLFWLKNDWGYIGGFSMRDKLRQYKHYMYLYLGLYLNLSEPDSRYRMHTNLRFLIWFLKLFLEDKLFSFKFFFFNCVTHVITQTEIKYTRMPKKKLSFSGIEPCTLDSTAHRLIFWTTGSVLEDKPKPIVRTTQLKLARKTEYERVPKLLSIRIFHWTLSDLVRCYSLYVATKVRKPCLFFSH